MHFSFIAHGCGLDGDPDLMERGFADGGFNDPRADFQLNDGTYRFSTTRKNLVAFSAGRL